ncbi:MAG: oligosaccharide flippase family protein [Gemmatimonadota bacterium]
MSSLESERIGRRFLALGGGEIVARLLSFAATIYLARVLSPALYGVIGVVMGVMLYLNQVADGGLELVGMPYVARHRDRAGSVAAPLLSLRVVLAVALTGLTAVLALAVLPEPDGPLLAVASLGMVATALSTRWVHLGLEGAGAVALARTAGEALTLGAIVIFVHGSADVGLVPVAHVAGAALTSLALLAALRARGVIVPLRWSVAEAVPVFRRSVSLVGFTLLGLLLFNFDLIFLRIVTSADAAGLYAAAYTLVAFAANVIVAFAHTVLPALVRLEGDRSARDAVYATACAHAFAMAVPVGVGAAFVAPLLIGTVFGAEYSSAAPALSWLALAIPLAALRELPIIGLLAAHREDRLLRVNALTVVANVALVTAFVPRYGLVGAAVCTVVTELLRLALAVHYARQNGLPLVSPARLFRPAAAAGVMAAALFLLGPQSIWVAIPVGAVVFGASLALMGGVQMVRGVPALNV